MSELPIGIFDSGIGGLTVLKELMNLIPNENLIYLGDTARVPYGIRSPETIIKYSTSNVNFLLKHDVKMIVIGCNTASAVATDIIKNKFDLPIVDVVIPGAVRAVNSTNNKRIGIIGTRGTINSNAYDREIKKLVPDAETFSLACPLFVSLAEEGFCDENDEISYLTAKRYLSYFMDKDIDTLVLGCTHYPLLIKVIQKAVGESIKLICSAEETALEVKRTLIDLDLSNTSSQKPNTSFYLTDLPNSFVETGRRFLGQELKNVKLIDI
jgi:glutamate racemase